MAVVPKPGARFRSVVCETEVVIVKGGTEEVDLRCGGSPVVPIAEPPGDRAPVAPFDEASILGKRYVAEDGAVEVLASRGAPGRSRSPRPSSSHRAPSRCPRRTEAGHSCTSS